VINHDEVGGEMIIMRGAGGSDSYLSLLLLSAPLIAPFPPNTPSLKCVLAFVRSISSR
jgi:hypothetical protein